jgi:hypothetical protein
LIATDASACFAATTALGGLGLVPRGRAEGLSAIGAAWRGAPGAADERHVRRLARRCRLAALTGGERRFLATLRQGCEPAVYLLVSHHHLEKPAILARLKSRSPARFICLIHDLIPIEYPEYAKPGQAENHRRRIETAIRFADALIVNSGVTRDALLPYLERAGSPRRFVSRRSPSIYRRSRPARSTRGRRSTGPISYMSARSRRAKTTCYCSTCGVSSQPNSGRRCRGWC